ncbi:MAG: hypothetical protein N3A71_03510 [Candidatus Dojkabacteria bacterium]|nr:hypothetical protein [Candidatus Dojkabacteria bacterium]
MTEKKMQEADINDTIQYGHKAPIATILSCISHEENIIPNRLSKKNIEFRILLFICSNIFIRKKVDIIV